MTSNESGEGNAAAAVLSTAGDGTAGDETNGPEYRNAAPAVRLVGGTGVCGAGAAGTGTVDFSTVAADLFSGACLVGAGPFSGSADRALRVNEAET